MLESGLTDNMKKSPLFARVESMACLLDDAVAATRRIITDLRPSILDDHGLLPAIKWQAEHFRERTGIECQVACTLTEDLVCGDCKVCKEKLDKPRSINLFRIFQESLNNVARHSGASRVEVEFHPGDNEIVLSLCDNGHGLPEGHVIAPTSYGIRGMRERVEQLGGGIEFDSSPAGGLCVRVKVPLPAVS